MRPAKPGRVRAVLLGLLGLALGLGAVCVGAPVTPPAVADDVHPEWGYVQGQDTTLLRGCHTYELDYALTPPPGNWAVEVFITGPDGATVATPVLLVNSDPLSGTLGFDLCKPSTPPGVFTVTPRLSVIDGVQPEQDGFLPTTTFTLVQAPRKPRPPRVWHVVPVHGRR